ncbi:MAG: radical SAM protein [Desulfobacteraceae bacterium]|nr:radical SAM protein [Desulfobacteraceae bacterium]
MNKPLKPLVIPVFIPHAGCPHQCAFCNQSIIANQEDSFFDPKKIDEIIWKYLKFKGLRKRVELAFYGGNFLGLPVQKIQGFLDHVKPFIDDKIIDSIRCSTRPDTITDEILDRIKPFEFSCVELGVQSMNDKVLKISRRGHVRADTVQAFDLLKAHEFKVGMQIMVGLPGDTKALAIETANEIAELGPDFVRIYPLVVLKDSLLAKWYTQNKYKPLRLAESIDLVKKLYLIFKKNNINVIRMGLQASDLMEDESMVLAGPWHPAFGHLVLSQIFLDKAILLIKNNIAFASPKQVVLRVHPSSESRLRGERNHNLITLEQMFPSIKISIKKDDALLTDEVMLGE